MEKVNILPAPTFRWLKVNEAGPAEAAAAPKEKESITLSEGERRTLLFEINEQREGLFERELEVELSAGAELMLAVVQETGGKTSLVHRVKARLSDNAKLSYVRLVLSGKETFENLETELAGRKSALNIDLAYLLRGKESLDVSYLASHKGEKTASEINVKGVLRDEARKLFRGTIDFLRGASGAVGNELEDVLLMDEGVRNQTIPLILCAEENVVGNHGATIGRLPEELIFYMESRGLKREEIYALMAKGKIAGVVRLLPEGEVKSRLEKELSLSEEEA